MAYANPGVFLQALQGAAQQHRMVLTKSLTTFATHQRSKTRYDISIQIYTKQSVCIYIYIAIYIYTTYTQVFCSQGPSGFILRCPKHRPFKHVESQGMADGSEIQRSNGYKTDWVPIAYCCFRVIVVGYYSYKPLLL